MTIFVGNLAFTTTEEELALLLHPYGVINRVRIVQSRPLGRSQGFGFVEMPDAREGRAALASLHGTTLGGRALIVDEARPRADREGPRRTRG